MKRLLYQMLWSMIRLPFVLLYHLVRWTYRALVGQQLTSDGYVIQKSRTGNEQFQHRAVAEDYLGRRLQNWEVVHHINGKRSDNSPSNLCVMSRKAHERYHQWYDWVRDNYGKPPRKETQLKKLREVFHGQILSEYSKWKNRVG